MNMDSFWIAWAAALAYCASTALLLQRAGRLLRGQSAGKKSALTLATVGFVLHTALLSPILAHDPLRLGLTEAVLLIGWQTALLLLLAAARAPLENLGLLLFPLLAISTLVHHPGTSTGPELALRGPVELHVLTAIVAYSLVVLAGAQAALLMVQNRLLHHHRTRGLLLIFPPLQTMERLLFQLIGLAFFMLSLALLSGFFFVDNLFAQHLVHKTVLSIAAWAILGMLLWGHYRFGWRGKVAVRWTLSGGAMLTLGYFGSKFVLETLLGRQWG